MANTKLEDTLLTPADAEKISKAATKLLSDALPLLEFDALHAIGALMLAAATAAAYGGLSVKQMADLMAGYHEQALVGDPDPEAVLAFPKPAGPAN